MPDGFSFTAGQRPSAEELDAEVNRVGQHEGVPPALIHSVIHQESGGNPYAVSNQGAAGLMQLEPDTAASLGVNDLFDWRQNLRGGTRYLKQGLDRYGGRAELAAAYYHGGPDEDQWGPKTAAYADTVASDYRRRAAAQPQEVAQGFSFEDATRAPPKGFSFEDAQKPQGFSFEDAQPPSPDEPQQRVKVKDLTPTLTEDVPVDETRKTQAEVTPPDQAVRDQITPELQAKTALEDRMVPQPPGAPATPAATGSAAAAAPGAGGRLSRIGAAIADAWTNSPTILTPHAQAWLDKTGLGGVTRLADIAMAAPNAVFAGLEQGAVETGQATGFPQTGKGAAEMMEYLTGPAMGDLPGMRVAPGEVSRETLPPSETPPRSMPTLEAMAAEAKPEAAPVAPVTPEAHATAELTNIAEGKPAEAPPAAAPNPPADVEVSGAAPGAPTPAEPPPGLKPVLDANGQWIGYERATEPTPPAVAAPPEAPTPEPVPAVPEPTAAPEPQPEAAPEQPAPRASRAATTPFEPVPKEPERLSSFLKRAGGIQDQGGDIRSSLGGAKYRPGLINKNGLPLDEAALLAWQNGYFPEFGDTRPAINDLREALHDDLNGRPVYSHQDEGALAAYQEATGRNTEIDRLSDEHGISTQGKTRDQFFDELADRMSQDEIAAEAASQAQAHADEYAAAEKAAKAWVAYHGTPHDFDQFDLSNIGTGEGAQAYGHGLYFAENPKVAGDYRRTLASWPKTVAGVARETLGSDVSLETARRIQQIAMAADRSTEVAGAAKRLYNSAPDLRQYGADTALGPHPQLERLIEAVRKVEQPGAVLTVRLHAKPEEMLDWDKPLSEQPSAVKAAWPKVIAADRADVIAKRREFHENAGDRSPFGPHNPIEGYAGASDFKQLINNGPERASRLMNEAGIKGIRYLDQGSRDSGEGTHNVVMFDPRDIEITHRNGEPVAKEPWNAQDFYGQSQARSLEDLENEHQQAALAPEALERAARGDEPGPTGTDQGAIPEGGQPRGGGAGTGRGDEAEAPTAGSWFLVDKATSKPVGETFDPKIAARVNRERYEAVPAAQYLADYNRRVKEAGGREPQPTPWAPQVDERGVLRPQTDLLGRPVGAPSTPRVAAATIRNDARQDLIPGTEPSAVQAQAARDAQGRGALQTDVAQKPADEGLFAPDTSGQGTLYSFPGALFDPAAWRRAFGSLGREVKQPGFEMMADKAGLAKAAAEVRAGLAPTSFRGAKPMEFAIRRHNAESAQAFDRAMHALDKVRGAVDQLSKQAQVEFTDRMERGEKQPTPALEAVSAALRDLLDLWTKKIQGLGKGYLANAIENYMGHIWGNYAEWAAQRPTELTQPEMQAIATARNVRRQPLRGSGSFLKQRSFPTQLEGIEAGLEPVTYNPVDLQMIKLHEMQKFYHGTVLADQIKNSKMATWVPATAEAEREAQLNGWQKLDDTIFKPRIMGANNEAGFGRLEPGNYWAPEPMARVFNNYMSQGWHGRSSIYDAVRMSNNALNTLQLGVSGFHAAFVTADTAISKVALGLQQISQGHPLRGTGNILEGATIAPAVARTVWRGAQLRKAWLEPENATPEMRQIVDALKTGGGRISMPRFFQTSASGTFFRNIGDLKNPQSAFHQVAQMFADAKTPAERYLMTPVRIAARVLDTVQQPLMGVLVPRAKLGVFYDMASNWLRDHPTATREEVADIMTKFQDSVDNRLGQLNYDNLFWNKVAKDIAFVTTRSVGWNLGTVREIGGAFVDSASAFKGMVAGKTPTLTTRMAYTMALPAVTMEIGAILTYLTTGKPPQSGLDYFYPPSGDPDANGNVDRRSIPGYMKDVIAFWHDPIQTALNKTAPMLETLNELRQNKDYYGGIIYDPARDRGPAQAYGDYLLNQAAPFSIRSYNRLHQEGAPSLDQALGFWGFQPAPRSITQPGRGEGYQALQNKKAFRARRKEPGRMQFFNAP